MQTEKISNCKFVSSLSSSKCFADICYLSNNIYDYVNVSQGKITIPNVDDGEECLLTDVSP